MTVDADVVSTGSVGSGKKRNLYTIVTFPALDGRIVRTTVWRSSVIGEKTVRVRYNPLNPEEAFEVSDITQYFLAMMLLVVAGTFLRLAYLASLHDGQDHFM